MFVVVVNIGTAVGLTSRSLLSAAGETLAGRAVAFAEGNALGKGPQILRLGPDDVEWIRQEAAAGNSIFMQLEVRHTGHCKLSRMLLVTHLRHVVQAAAKRSRSRGQESLVGLMPSVCQHIGLHRFCRVKIEQSPVLIKGRIVSKTAPRSDDVFKTRDPFVRWTCTEWRRCM